MKTKKVCLSELAYVIGIVVLALGTALMERADFGMSMVVAPAYLLHLKISEYLPVYTFGMSEYIFQAFLLFVITILLRRFKVSYLFSFATALIYGFTLDICIRVVGIIPFSGLPWRFVFYIVGMVLCSIGVAFLFHTYLSPEAYELFVKEFCAKTNANISKVKTIYDCCSCLIAIVMSFVFFGFGHFEGVKAGTIVCAIVNGWLIGRFSSFLESEFKFKDALPFRGFFERN